MENWKITGPDLQGLEIVGVDGNAIFTDPNIFATQSRTITWDKKARYGKLGPNASLQEFGTEAEWEGWLEEGRWTLLMTWFPVPEKAMAFLARESVFKKLRIPTERLPRTPGLLTWGMAAPNIWVGIGTEDNITELCRRWSRSLCASGSAELRRIIKSRLGKVFDKHLIKTLTMARQATYGDVQSVYRLDAAILQGALYTLRVEGDKLKDHYEDYVENQFPDITYEEYLGLARARLVVLERS